MQVLKFFAFLNSLWSKKESTKLFVSSGVCLFFITFPWLGFLVLPGLVLFIFATLKSTNIKEVFLGGWFVGTMKLSGAISWWWYAYPLDWLSIGLPIVELIGIAFFWLLISVSGGLAFAFVASAVFKQKMQSFKLLLLTFPLIWLFGEVMQSFFLSLIFLGPGSYVNANLAYGYVGLSLANFDFVLSLARFGGVYSLTFLTAFASTLAYGFLRNKNENKKLLIMGSFLLFAVLLFSNFYNFFIKLPTRNEANVIALNTVFPAASLSSEEGVRYKSETVLKAVKVALSYSPDYIVLPEDSRLTLSFDSRQSALEYLLEISADPKTVLVDTSRYQINEQSVVLRAFIYDLGEEEVYVIDKQFLVPQGEYVPYLYKLIVSVFGGKRLVDKMEQNQNYIPGPYKSSADSNVGLPGVLFCYGSVSGRGVSSLPNLNKIPFVAHPISHAWFHQPILLWHQQDTMLKVQAIWNQKHIVSAGNMFQGRWYKSNGDIEKGTELISEQDWSLVQYEISY